IHVSNFRAVKRIDTVIETFAKIHQKLPSKLILLGDGPQLMDMKAKARELDIEDAVLFLGKQNWVSEFYQISDLVLYLIKFTHPILRSEDHTSELQSRFDLVCRLLL